MRDVVGLEAGVPSATEVENTDLSSGPVEVIREYCENEPPVSPSRAQSAEGEGISSPHKVTLEVEFEQGTPYTPEKSLFERETCRGQASISDVAAKDVSAIENPSHSASPPYEAQVNVSNREKQSLGDGRRGLMLPLASVSPQNEAVEVLQSLVPEDIRQAAVLPQSPRLRPLASPSLPVVSPIMGRKGLLSSVFEEHQAAYSNFKAKADEENASPEERSEYFGNEANPDEYVSGQGTESDESVESHDSYILTPSRQVQTQVPERIEYRLDGSVISNQSGRDESSQIMEHADFMHGTQGNPIGGARSALPDIYSDITSSVDSVSQRELGDEGAWSAEDFEGFTTDKHSSEESMDRGSNMSMDEPTDEGSSEREEHSLEDQIEQDSVDLPVQDQGYDGRGPQEIEVQSSVVQRPELIDLEDKSEEQEQACEEDSDQEDTHSLVQDQPHDGRGPEEIEIQSSITQHNQLIDLKDELEEEEQACEEENNQENIDSLVQDLAYDERSANEGKIRSAIAQRSEIIDLEDDSEDDSEAESGDKLESESEDQLEDESEGESEDGLEDESEDGAEYELENGSDEGLGDESDDEEHAWGKENDQEVIHQLRPDQAYDGLAVKYQVIQSARLRSTEIIDLENEAGEDSQEDTISSLLNGEAQDLAASTTPLAASSHSSELYHTSSSQALTDECDIPEYVAYPPLPAEDTEQPPISEYSVESVTKETWVAQPDPHLQTQLITPTATQQTQGKRDTSIELIYQDHVLPTPQLTQSTTMGLLPFEVTSSVEEKAQSTSQKLEIMKISLAKRRSGRTSNVPDIISPWFASKRPSQVHQESDDSHGSDRESEQSVESRSDEAVLRTEGRNDQKELYLPATQIATTTDDDHANVITSKARSTPPPPGLRTPLSYFTPLAALQDHFASTIDILAIASSTTPVQRSKSGPKDYHLTLEITDPSTDSSVTSVQIFRPFKEALPVIPKGAPILLRNFKVQSLKHNFYLISTASSAWAVFEKGKGVQMNGPPVEMGAEERGFAKGLSQWWASLGQGVDEADRVQSKLKRRDEDDTDATG